MKRTLYSGIKLAVNLQEIKNYRELSEIIMEDISIRAGMKCYLRNYTIPYTNLKCYLTVNKLMKSKINSEERIDIQSIERYNSDNAWYVILDDNYWYPLYYLVDIVDTSSVKQQKLKLGLDIGSMISLLYKGSTKFTKIVHDGNQYFLIDEDKVYSYGFDSLTEDSIKNALPKGYTYEKEEN